MIKILIKHFIYEISLQNLFNNVLKNFSSHKLPNHYIRTKDLTEQHLGRRIITVYDPTMSYIVFPFNLGKEDEFYYIGCNQCKPDDRFIEFKLLVRTFDNNNKPNYPDLYFEPNEIIVFYK